MRKPDDQAMGHPSAEGDGPPAPLGFLLRKKAAAHRLRMERALSDLDVTPPQFLLLTMVAHEAGRSNADLARVTALSAPTISVIIENLVRRGAVQRRADELHGRIQHLDLTEPGHALLAACRQRAYTVELELTDGLPAANVAIIREWLAGV